MVMQNVLELPIKGIVLMSSIPVWLLPEVQRRTAKRGMGFSLGTSSKDSTV